MPALKSQGPVGPGKCSSGQTVLREFIMRNDYGEAAVLGMAYYMLHLVNMITEVK